MAAIGQSGRTSTIQWPIRAATGQTLDTQWPIHIGAAASLDIQWADQASVTPDLRLRWTVESLAARYPDANGWTAVRASARTVSALSREWVRLTLTTPTGVSPLLATAALAVIPLGAEPGPADWQAATWDPDGHPIYSDDWPLQVLAGPGTVLPLRAGTYGLWFRIETSTLGLPHPPETIVVEAGQLAIT
jgi:hypothetical protein